jgi:aldose 1-epimerase
VTRPSAAAVAGLTREAYGHTADGEPVERYTLINRGGTCVRVLTYGGILQSFEVPDRHGRSANIVLGFADLAGYLSEHPYFGATVGRYGNRIAGAAFDLDGQTYRLAANNGPNSLHGGLRGFDKRVWRATPVTPGAAAGTGNGGAGGDGAGVRLSYVSPDGEEGFPGTLRATVTYTLTDRDELRIDYHATTDRPTVVNLTNHSYFNLAGEGSGDVHGHRLQIAADAYLPTDATQIPTGRTAQVEGTPFDFTRPRLVGERIRSAHPQMVTARGYDHTFVLDKADRPAAGRPTVNPPISDRPTTDRPTAEGAAFAAELTDPGSGRVMRVHTTEPGIQLYTANHLGGDLVGAGGRTYRQGAGLCLETQHFPDSPNRPDFPSTVLRPGEEYASTTVYALSR